MNISFKPIGPWPVVAIAALIVTGLTLWAYRERLKGTRGGWRYVALALRLAAILLCLLAALRPAVLINEKRKENASVVVLVDATESMNITDEVGGQSRWKVARKAVEQARKAITGGKESQLELKVYQFDRELREEASESAATPKPATDDKAKAEPKPDANPDDKKAAPAPAPVVAKKADTDKPTGAETAIGTAMSRVVKELQGTRISRIILTSDGSNNGGGPPLDAAQQLKALQIPVYTVPVGSENAAASSRDIAVRDLVAGPVVFVKNQPEIRGVITARGFANQSLDIELHVEGEPNNPVATRTIKAPEASDTIPITGLKYIPQTAGEKRVTLKVKPRDGELITSNNEISTYMTVLSGGLKVLYVQGSNFSHEYRFLTRALDAAKEIHADLEVVREPAHGDTGLLKDGLFTPNAYDVYILGDIPAEYFTQAQIRQLALNVRNGAGLLMLGGRSSFGSGGWATTELSAILPVDMHPDDGQLEPEEGLKLTPNPAALDNYVLRLNADRAESERLWKGLAPIMGTNRFSRPKASANLLLTAGREPVMLSIDIGRGRSIAFGGETWPWVRSAILDPSSEGLLSHARFWRQAILWLAHKENNGESQVKLKLDRRRMGVGQKLEVIASARDSKNEPVTDVQYETTVTLNAPNAKPEPLQLFLKGEDFTGSYFANGQPGEYTVSVKGTRQGKTLGSDTARFMVYQDNRELERPAADLALLKQISEITGGEVIRPEDVGKQLAKLGPDASEYTTQSEHRVWDNWPFFLVFTTLLTLEWALRKAKGWA